MKKKILLILHPYKFTEFTYYRYELSHFKKKKYKIIVHDLSQLVSNKDYDKVFKTRIYKKSLVFYSIYSWLKEFNRLRNNHKDILIYDFLHFGEQNLKAFFIQVILKHSNLPILKHNMSDIATLKVKKNLKFFINKIKYHNLNIGIYFYSLKEIFFSFLISILRFNKLYLMVNKINKKNKLSYKKNYILGHSFDYSKNLIRKEKPSNKNIKKYILYFDSGVPYFGGDNPAIKRNPVKINNKKYYNDLNLYFDELEKFYKAKIIVIPHAKYKIKNLGNKNLNPYFNKRINDNSYDAISKWISKSLLVISHGSSALSYAVAHYKPMHILFSKKHNFWTESEKKNIFFQSKILESKIIDFTNIKKKDFSKNFKINKYKYDNYKYRYLTYKTKNTQKPINKIIQDLMQNL